MKNSKFIVPFALMLGLVVILSSCEIESISEVSATKVTSLLNDCDAVIDFQPLPAGTIVDALSSGNGVSGVAVPGTIVVYGENLDPARPDVNHAMIFDTDNPTGGDTDLVIPGADYMNVLIISEDLDSDDPDDDNVPGGIFTFDFSGFATGVVDVLEFNAIDTEEGGSYEAYDSDGILITSGAIGSIADGTDQAVAVNAVGVEVFVVTLDGSGAVDNFCVNVEEDVEEGCTLTQGFWKNPKKGPWPSPFNRDDEFYLSGQSWQDVLLTAPKDNAYYQAAHQFIAASLNGANGASSTDEVDAAIALGQDLFSFYEPGDIAGLSGDDPLREQFISINDTLDAYNKGDIGPGHCDD